MTYVFDDPAFSGTVSYDSSTAVSLEGDLAGFTGYSITSLSVAFDDGIVAQTWNLQDYVDIYPFPDSVENLLLVVDPLGTWEVSAIDVSNAGWSQPYFINSANYGLIFSSQIVNGQNRWEEQPRVWLSDYSYYGTFFASSTYQTAVTTVPLPGALWLLGSGLAGLVGIARRK
ncbi:MAG TPA: VPLPA-CTERM sorting domain-containing protein [Gammaproteobacteria bacterium]